MITAKRISERNLFSGKCINKWRDLNLRDFKGLKSLFIFRCRKMYLNARDTISQLETGNFHSTPSGTHLVVNFSVLMPLIFFKVFFFCEILYGINHDHLNSLATVRTIHINFLYSKKIGFLLAWNSQRIKRKYWKAYLSIISMTFRKLIYLLQKLK